MSIDSDPDPLRQRLLLELHRLIFSASGIINTYTSQLGLHGKDGEALLLVWQAELENKPLTPSDLAEALHTTRAAASYQVDRLVEQGLLQRIPDPTDRRRTRLSLRQQDTHVAHYFTAPLSHRMTRLFAKRTPAEITTFTAMLGELTETLQTWHQGDLS